VITVVNAAAWGAESCVQNDNTRLVTEAARIPALTLAVGAQLVCVTGITGMDDADTAGANAPEVADGEVADISLSS